RALRILLAATQRRPAWHRSATYGIRVYGTVAMPAGGVLVLQANEYPDHLANYRQREYPQLLIHRPARQLLEAAAHHLLVLAGAIANQRGWGVHRQAGGDQVARDFAEAAQPHVEHQGLVALGQGVPGQV